MEAKKLRHKMADYIRFAQVLLAVSTLLMIGLLLPGGHKEAMQIYVMMGTIGLFLGMAFLFFQRVKLLREQVEQLEEQAG